MSKFRLRKRKIRRAIPREIPFRSMAPNLVTFMAAASGVTSIRFSSCGEWKKAVVFILLACLFDGLDGRVARLLKATSKLGAELDSLSDFVSFGVAPGILVYFWLMEKVTEATAWYSYRGCFWAFALFFAMCCAFRLARFNIMLEMPTQPYWKHFFMGLPAPGGAALAILPIAWQINTHSDAIQNPLVGSLSLIICGVLMACRIPTLSAKNLRVKARFLLPVLLVVMFLIGMLVAQFWQTMTVLGILYYISVPVCAIAYLKAKKAYLSSRGAEQEKAQIRK